MDRETLSENKEVILYESKPVIESDIEIPNEEERIREYQPRRKRDRTVLVLQLWRFLALTVGFAAIFVCLYFSFAEQKGIHLDVGTSELIPSDQADVPVAAVPENTISESSETDTVKQPKLPPLVIDESMTGIDISEDLNDDYSLGALFGTSEGIKVIIVHSHNSEYVSKSISVYDAGEALAQILTSAGIETYHSNRIHDEEGSIGSYDRMNDTVLSLLNKYTDALFVIDLHDSDSGLPLTFTVGTDSGYGWRENLRLVSAVYKGMEGIEGAIRFLPGDLGQNTGLLTVNVGIGGNDYDDETARKAVAAFAEAFMKLCNNNASVEQ